MSSKLNTFQLFFIFTPFLFFEFEIYQLDAVIAFAVPHNRLHPVC